MFGAFYDLSHFQIISSEGKLFLAPSLAICIILSNDPLPLGYSLLHTLQFVYMTLKMWHSKWNANCRWLIHVRDTDIILWVNEAMKHSNVKNNGNNVAEAQQNSNYILNVLFTFRISKSILNKKLSQNVPYTFYSQSWY